MKPVTPQEYAKCYGQLIVDINSFNLPSLTVWFNARFQSEILIAKLNPEIFKIYLPSIQKLPPVPTFIHVAKTKDYVGDYNKSAALYRKQLDLSWNTLTIELKNSLILAEVDPIRSQRLLSEFTLLKPNPTLNPGKW